MPYMPGRRYVSAYVIDEPASDRPYFCHTVPMEYLGRASERGGRIYSFLLNLRSGESFVSEISLTRQKALSDIVSACRVLPEPTVSFDMEELARRREENVQEAALCCRRIEIMDRILFMAQKQSTLRDDDPRFEAVKIPWRGSVSDLATDIRGELSDAEVATLIEELKGRGLRTH